MYSLLRYRVGNTDGFVLSSLLESKLGGRFQRIGDVSDDREVFVIDLPHAVTQQSSLSSLNLMV